MRARVVLLAELLVLVGADYLALKNNVGGDAVEAARSLPATAGAAFLLWALLFLLADLGYGTAAGTFGLIVVLSFTFAYWSSIEKSIDAVIATLGGSS